MRTQGGHQTSYVLRDRGFNVSATIIHVSMEPLFHLAPITRLRPLAGVAFVEGNHGRSNVQFLAGQVVVVLTVIAGVG